MILRKLGFTLVELLIVIAIIGIIAAGIIVAINPGKRTAQARDAVRKADLNQIVSALETEYVVTNSYHRYEEIGYDSSTGCAGSGCSAGEQADSFNNWSPSSSNLYRTLVDTGTLKTLPKDPINNSTYKYVFEPDSYGEGHCSELPEDKTRSCAYKLYAKLEETGDEYWVIGVSATSSVTYLTSQNPSSESVTLILPMFNQQAVDLIKINFKSLVRENDILYVNSGGTGSLNMVWVNDAISQLRTVFPNNKIVGSTSGHTNLSTMANQISSEASMINYNYEPNFANIPEFSWDFPTTLSNVDQAKDIASSNGKQLMTSPTGRPLLQASLQQYNWNYGEIKQEANYLIVQTQTYCKNSTQKFEEAVDKLLQQNSNDTTGWAPQITVSSTDVNGVSAQQGYNCAQSALDREIKTLSIWWNLNSPDFLEDFLILLGR